MENLNVLEFDEWIKLAETKNILLRPEDYLKLIPNKEYIAVEADYIRFLFIEYYANYKIEANTTYSPQDLYERAKLKTILIPTGEVKKENDYVMQSDCTLMLEPIKYYEFLMKRDLNNQKFGGFRLCGINNVNNLWLTSGSGDGYSRWMLWDHLIEMPNIYFRDYNSESENDST